MYDYRPAGRGPFAIQLADIQPSDRVLNVGCFNGHLERYFLKNKCKDFKGIDANEEAVKFAKTLPDGEHFQVGFAEDLPFEDASFDKVFCLDVLEHVQDEDLSIREIQRVLAPGGVLVLSVPNDFLNFLDPDELTRGLRNLVRKHIKKKPLLDHPKHRHYSELQLRQFLKGFEIEKVHRSGTPVFWSLAMFYNAINLPDSVSKVTRKFTDPVENFEYALGLPTGFNIMIKARKFVD